MTRASLGTACVLGLRGHRQEAPPTTAYLMVGENCRFDCGFCPQGRSSRGKKGRLARVIWPPVPTAQAAERIAEAYHRGALRRACLQVVHGPGYREHLKTVLATLSSVCGIPISVSTSLSSPEQAHDLYSSGAASLALPLDAATPDLFAGVKSGGKEEWHRRLALLEELARRYPGQVTTHLIVGLGESEREALELIDRLVTAGVTVGLFAFTPASGTPLAGHPAPALDSYRRVQIGQYLLARGYISPDDLLFAPDQGRLMAIRGAGDLFPALAGGDAFRTTGCPDCNRPYYNESPGQIPYNYPRPLSPAEASEAVRAAGLEGIDE